MSDNEVGITEIINVLKNAILNPVKGQIEQFITQSLNNFVNEDNLNYAIENDLDILTLAMNHYGFGHSRVTPIFKLSMKMYWDEAELYLTNVEKVFSLISKKPGCAKIINTEKGRSYLNRCCTQTYSKLYNFVWEDG